MPSAGGAPKPVVLLVDDSEDNRVMYAELLSLHGFDVLEADDGVQAVATARARIPDAIVMDVVLPAIDGLEATRMLRADPATQDIIVIALSGHGPEVEAEAKTAGVTTFLRKPCAPKVLVETLRSLLSRSAS